MDDVFDPAKSRRNPRTGEEFVTLLRFMRRQKTEQIARLMNELNVFDERFPEAREPKPGTKKKRPSPIAMLRKAHPGVWRYDVQENTYEHESGRTVVATAQLAPRYDGDDSSFVTSWWWTDNGEMAIAFTREWTA